MAQHQQSVEDLARKLYEAFVEKWAKEVLKVEPEADLETPTTWTNLEDYEHQAWIAAATVSIVEQRRNRSPIILPNEVLLTWDNPTAKRAFMSQLSDGWGENEVSLTSNPMWDPTLHPFDNIGEFHVTNLSGDEDEDTQVD